MEAPFEFQAHWASFPIPEPTRSPPSDWVSDGVRTRDTWSHSEGLENTIDYGSAQSDIRPSGLSGADTDASARTLVALDETRDDSDAARAAPSELSRPGRELDLGGVVEPALARALIMAAEAGQWAIVARLAGELEARRVARQGGGDSGTKVIPLGTPRPQRA